MFLSRVLFFLRPRYAGPLLRTLQASFRNCGVSLRVENKTRPRSHLTAFLERTSRSVGLS